MSCKFERLRMRARRFRFGLLCWLSLACFGCASSGTSFLHPNVDFSHIQRCALLPFLNLTSDTFANERLQSVFLTEILNHPSLTLVDPEETVSAMKQLHISLTTALTPEQIVALGKSLKVDGVFLGSVEEYGEASHTRSPTFAVTAVFDLAETETGNTIWRCQVHVDGSSLWRKLFGGDSASLYAVSRKAVQKALGTLF